MRARKTELVMLALICLTLALSAWQPARAQDLPKQQCDDLMYVRAEEQKGYLDFPGSPFKPIVKVTVSFRCVKHGTMGKERLYEDLWYQGKNPLGCRRYCDFDLDPKDLIFVYLNTSTAAEHAASANTLVRLLLESLLNRDAICGVSVPAESFWTIVDQMEEENFYRTAKLQGRPSVYISMPLMAEDGHKATVVWAESTN
jgi:hypothetical protein